LNGAEDPSRERSDTIKCIVESLVTEGSELAGEAQVPIVAEFEHEDYSNPNWKPEPPDAGPSICDVFTDA